jgi:predicted RNase H-like HicB family nuclease
MKFQVTLTQDGHDYVARCPQLPDAVARGHSVNEALESIKAVIAARFRPDNGSEDGTAPVPHPVSPKPSHPGIAKQIPHNGSDA